MLLSSFNPHSTQRKSKKGLDVYQKCNLQMIMYIKIQKNR